MINMAINANQSGISTVQVCQVSNKKPGSVLICIPNQIAMVRNNKKYNIFFIICHVALYFPQFTAGFLFKNLVWRFWQFPFLGIGGLT